MRRTKFRSNVMRARHLENLPVDDVTPRLRDTLRTGTSALLVAPPGAGKTTRVPLALLDEPWMLRAKVIMLEPRRLAARAAAQHMARLLGEGVGDTIGYRVRMDARVSTRTRIEVVTEGVLTRMLVDDPTLEGVNLVIFDEFHERSLNADVGLALTLHSRDLVRDDLRVLVMSATLDAERVANLLGDAPVIVSHGRSYPVDTHHVPPRIPSAREATVLAAIERALREHEGDMLVFLPGAGEIQRVANALQGRALPHGVYVAPLHGALPLDAQDQAIQPSPAGSRKIVLATTIAQTSLTIEGVRVVIDAGLTRIPRYSVRSGMTRLDTVTVSRAAADQRRGRAGRLGPGVCYRLWDAAQDATLREHDIPEILEADLAPLALDLAAAGVRDPLELRWLDPPPQGALAQARDLLRELEAIDAQHVLTQHGKALATLGTHPRLGHMLLRARAIGHAALACDLAAILEERDVVSGAPAERDPDIRSRVAILHGARSGAAIDRAALQRLRAAAQRWRDRAGGVRDVGGVSDAEGAGPTLALAYPDRVAQRRAGSAPRYVLRNGIGAQLPAGSPLHNEPFLVAAELDGRKPESRILLAAPIALEDVERLFGDQIEARDAIAWNDATGSISARRVRALGAVLLADDPLAEPNADQVQTVLRDAIVASEFRLLDWTREATALRQRIAFLRAQDAAWPDMSTSALAATADRWLTSRLVGRRQLAQLRRISVAEALLDLLTWQQRRKLDELAPSHVAVPSGSRIAIDYSDPRAPVLAVRLQEVFGLTQTPTICGGRVRLTIHLLSPSQRPVQVTTDLASFWRTSYFDVRKELRGRYPKHHWPEDPLQAEPTRRTKRRSDG